MTMLSETVAAKSEQLTADDLMSGARLLKVTNVTGTGNRDQPIAVYFEGDDGKPFLPCKTIRRVLLHCWGDDGKAFIGRTMEVYRDPNVKFGGLLVGGIRIKRLSHIKDKQVVPVQASKGAKMGYTVLPLPQDTAPAAPSLTIDAARDLLDGAEDLDSLRAVWSRKSMAPFRGDLQALLDKRKAALTPLPTIGPDVDTIAPNDDTFSDDDFRGGFGD